MSEIVPTNGSPFDALRHEDERGEYWLARELMTPLEYGKWQDFAAVVERAKASLTLVEGDGAAAANFTEVRKKAVGRGRIGIDYRLTRFAAYLTSMAADDTKQAVAEARVYFAVRTREAEIASITQGPKLDKDLAVLSDMLIAQQLIRNETEQNTKAILAQAIKIIEHGARLDSIEHNSDYMTILGYAKLNGVPMNDAQAAGLGRILAPRYRRQFSEEPPSTRDQRHGTVFMYPLTLLDEVFAERGLKR